MRTLGIHCGHDAAIAIAEDGKIVYAMEEERLTGEKKQHGFPARSLLVACRDLGIGINDFDKVAYSQKYNFFFRSCFVKEGNVHGLYPEATFCDHHYAHAVSAYSWSGFDDCIVMTLDGGGDELFASIWEAKDGRLTKIDTCGFIEYPFGIFYNQLTEVLGFKPNRHEGKVMGLAAHGKYTGMFDGLFWVEGTKIRSSGKKVSDVEVQPLVGDRLNQLFGGLPKEQRPSLIDVAANGQATFEKVVLEWVEKNAKGRNLAVAGGCFANVLANMKIAKLVKRLFVTPAMFDSGLAVGAALSLFDPLPCYRPKDMYLGIKASKPRMEKVYSATDVARMVEAGKVVGLFQGRMEFGPRALGNRTILADPRNRGINHTLNQRLARSEFMPFAPVILEEWAEDILEDYATGKDSAEFMTSCWSVKPHWRDKIPAVVHVDGTVRPQILRRETNPYYYDIVFEFYKLTGIPVLINTSFNGHESPILATNAEADWMKHIGQIDVLVEA